MGVTLCAVSLFWSRVPPFDATLTFGPDEYDGHNIWNPLLELLCLVCISAYSWMRYVMKKIWGEARFLVILHLTSFATKE